MAVAVAMTLPPASASEASRFARSPSRCTIRPVPVSRPGLTGRRKLTPIWSVDWNWSGASVASRAGPTVSYSIAATNAPSTLPAGLVNASVA